MHPAALIGISLWRLAIVVCALTGFWLALGGDWTSMAYLTLQSNLLTGLVYLVLLAYPLVAAGRYEPVRRWVRGALAVLMTLVSVTYLTLLSGDLSQPRDLLCHLITPLLVGLDWLVGESQSRTPWWYPPTWLALPIGYLVFYVVNGQRLYGFLDPRDPGVVLIAGFLVALLAVGYALYGLGKLRALIAGGPR